MCHTQQNKRAGAGSADFTPFIHKIHMGEKLAVGEVIAGVDVHEITYPQDIRNCTMCHKGTDVNNWKTKPTMKSCGSCHNGLDFAAHQGGQTNDQFCAGCHAGASAIKEVAASHQLNDQTGNNPVTPAGLSNFTYAISEVKLNASNQPEFKFQIKKDGAAVTFNANTATYPLTGFIDYIDPASGRNAGLNFYVVYSVPQDGIAEPADFNARSNVSLVNIWKGTHGTLTGPDANGFYTATLTTQAATSSTPAAAIKVPANAKMLTGAMIGNFAQVTASGNVARNTKDAIKVATGYTGRRAIVDNAKCNKCHDQLGITPSFHGGARNDAALCAFCHTVNQTSSGWSANASTFVHGIHAAKKRSVPFNWHSAKDAAGNWTLYYPHVTYPGVLRNCEQCHVTGSYDFSSTTALAAVPNLLWTTDATGKFDGADTTKNFAFSPYVIKDNLYNYGTGFSYAPATDVTTQAASTTLVSSPISAACFSCHDTKMAKDHMVNMGGTIYEPRSTVMTNGAFSRSETCLTCHGSAANSLNSSIPTIKSVHRWW
jgi:OmcA/MtrC family decaheme c-type cytochrome